MDKPDSTFEREGMEIGLRLRGVIYDAIVSLNAFYGRDNDTVRRVIGGPASVDGSDFDERQIWHLTTESEYPILRFVGATFARDFPSLSSSALGGVAPTWRAEVLYVGSFTNTGAMASPPETFEKSDEIRWMVGMDWKVKINCLNPKAYFLISPQIYHRHIVDYAEGVSGISYDLSDYQGPIEKNNYLGSIMINTTYFHSKLQPMFFWLHDFTGNAHMIKTQIAWEPSHKWKYTLGALFLHGNETGVSFQPLDNKDQAYCTIAYKF
jgi:hypothetical protein